jgi:hypothetical protein
MILAKDEDRVPKSHKSDLENLSGARRKLPGTLFIPEELSSA